MIYTLPDNDRMPSGDGKPSKADKAYAAAMHKARAHQCQPSRTCKCRCDADEPNESCPLHGYGDDRRCEICGRWMKRA